MSQISDSIPAKSSCPIASGHVRAIRAYAAGLGTAGALLAGAAVLFVLASALVSFQGWPQIGDRSAPLSVVVAPPGPSASGTGSRATRRLAVAVIGRRAGAPAVKAAARASAGAAAKGATGAIGLAPGGAVVAPGKFVAGGGVAGPPASRPGTISHPSAPVAPGPPHSGCGSTCPGTPSGPPPSGCGGTCPGTPGGLGATVKSTTGAVGSTISGAGATVGSAVGSAASKLAGTLSPASPAVSGALSGAGQAAGGTVAGVSAGAGSTVSGAGNALGGVLQH